VEHAQQMKQCANARTLTLRDVKRYMGPPELVSGSAEDRTWVYGFGPKNTRFNFWFDDFCEVTVMSKARTVTGISIVAC